MFLSRLQFSGANGLFDKSRAFFRIYLMVFVSNGCLLRNSVLFPCSATEAEADKRTLEMSENPDESWRGCCSQMEF